MPLAKLSDGLTTTLSFPVRPSMTSSLAPRSRPILIGRISTFPSGLTIPTEAPSSPKETYVSRHQPCAVRTLSLQPHLRIGARKSSPDSFGTCSSVSSVRVVGSIAPAVRTTVAGKCRLGNSLKLRSAWVLLADRMRKTFRHSDVDPQRRSLSHREKSVTRSRVDQCTNIGIAARN